MDVLGIKKRRRELQLTQEELAKKAGVSQSLIAKIESGLINPSYEKATHIINTLEKEHAHAQPTAKDLAHKHLTTCSPEEELREVIKRMHKKAISQVPVLKQETVVGLITETGLLEKILDKKLDGMCVEEVMQPPPPLVDESTPRTVILALLKHTPIVVVTRKGKVCGVITRADIIMHK